MRLSCTAVMAIMLFALTPCFAQNNPSDKPATQPSSSKNILLNPLITTDLLPVSNALHGGFITDRCGFVTQANKALSAGYNKATFEAVIQAKIEEIKRRKLEGKVDALNYIIPVVFHVIHDGTAVGAGANIVASQIYEQIDQLNKDFGNQSGSPFPVAANTGLSFCPVLVDPSGTALAQAGIDRINRVTQGWTDPTTFGNSTAQVNAMIDYINATIKPASIWDPTKYVNIWMYNFSASGLLGYATFPTAGLADLPPGETPTTAGIVFLSGAIGSVASPGTAGNYGLGRTVTHELGHFFGLYHVWGDVTTCTGTDYCGDTPPCSDAYFSTVPGCTIPTQCSSMPRMIQNYMDYSDDGCMNTFTQNQTDRIAAVMAASPRRPNNPGVTICTPPATNALSFTTAINNISETGNVSACPRFKDYVISVKPAVAATGNATVNLAFSGSATLSSDYTLIGSTSFSYTNGDVGTKSITVRVIDDAAAEAVETIIINFSITGSGLVPATTNLTHTITISDNDVTAAINNSNPVSTIFSEDFGTIAASGNLPAGWIKGTFVAGSNIFTVNSNYGSSTGFTTGTNGRVLHITNGNASAQTNETAIATYTATSATDAVAVTPSINTQGFANIKVSFDYAVLGESDVDGVYDYGMLRYSTTAQGSGLVSVTDGSGNIIKLYGNAAKQSISVSLPAAAANLPNLWIAFEWINDDNVRGVPPVIIDNIVITGDNSGVETVANQSVTQVQNLGQTAQYMSLANKIIARVNNLDANVGCIAGTVTQSGTGIQTLLTSSGSYMRSNKVIQISPAAANSTAAYDVVLYYTTAELASWSSNVPNLKVLKVADGVNLSGTLTPSNAVVYTPVVDDQRATKGYVSYTVSVTGGFSQFLLVSPLTALPVLDLKFRAKAAMKNIVLNWGTESEINNKGFILERSNDGTNFEKIGWLDGKINSSRPSAYAYTDNAAQVNVLYYYRLKQVDLDNRSFTSETRQAKISWSGMEISLTPNPAKNHVKLFVKGSALRASLKLFSAAGEKVREWQNINLASPVMLDISGLSNGIYLVYISVGDKNSVEKLYVR